MAKQQQSKGGKRYPNPTPARERYKAEGRLEKYKVFKLIHHNGMKPAEARKFWRKAKGIA